MVIMTMMLTESEVTRVDEKLIRIGECLYQIQHKLEALTDVQTYLKKKLGENRVYIAVRAEQAYYIYRQAAIAAPVIVEQPVPETVEVVPVPPPTEEAESILYYRGQPYKKTQTTTSQTTPLASTSDTVDVTEAEVALYYRGQRYPRR